jgi:hypothetical protein
VFFAATQIEYIRTCGSPGWSCLSSPVVISSVLKLLEITKIRDCVGKKVVKVIKGKRSVLVRNIGKKCKIRLKRPDNKATWRFKDVKEIQTKLFISFLKGPSNFHPPVITQKTFQFIEVTSFFCIGNQGRTTVKLTSSELTDSFLCKKKHPKCSKIKERHENKSSKVVWF